MSAVCFAIIHIVDDNVECFTTNLRINLKIWVNYINMNFINMVRPIPVVTKTFTYFKICQCFCTETFLMGSKLAYVQNIDKKNFV